MLNRPKLRSTQPLLSRGKNQADAAIVPLIIRQIPERRLAPALEDGLLQAGQMDFRLGGCNDESGEAYPHISA